MNVTDKHVERLGSITGISSVNKSKGIRIVHKCGVSLGEAGTNMEITVEDANYGKENDPIGCLLVSRKYRFDFVWGFCC